MSKAKEKKGRREKNEKLEGRVNTLQAVNDGRKIQRGIEVSAEILNGPIPFLLTDDQIKVLKRGLDTARKYPELVDSYLGTGVIHLRIHLKNMGSLYEHYTKSSTIRTGRDYLKALGRREAILANWSPYRDQLDSLKRVKD